MSNTAVSDIAKIEQFVADAKIELSSNIEIKETPYGGLGVYALTDLESNQILARIPKKSCYTSENSSIANLLVDAEVSGALALTIAFAYEVSVFQKTSHWYTYLSTINWKHGDKLYLPPSYWPKNEKKHLRGTTLDILYDALSPQEEVEEGFEIACDLAQKWNSEFELAIPPVFETGNAPQETVYNKFLEFVSMGYAISSRAFEIDNYHQTGLVCIADIFNHSSDPDVHFESNYNVCAKCGESGECSHLIGEAHLEARLESEQDEKYLAKVKPDASSFLRAVQEMENENDDDMEDAGSDEEHLEEDVEVDEEEDDVEVYEEGEDDEESDGDEGDNDDEFCDMRLVKPLPKGQEILSTYGDLSNVSLLSKYGFALENNVHDIVTLVLEVKSFLEKNRHLFQERLEWWDSEGHAMMEQFIKKSEEIEDDSEDESDGESDGEESDEGTHEHQHGPDCNHEHDDEDEEEEDEEEQSRWLESMYIDAEGQVSQMMLVFAKLLALHKIEWDQFKSLKTDEKRVEILSTSTKACEKILATIIGKKPLLEIPNTDNESVMITLKRENEIILSAKHTYK